MICNGKQTTNYKRLFGKNFNKNMTKSKGEKRFYGILVAIFE
jgi:hypothetical protein